jgi:glycosyltransferase involved in cell wall biosynthesis
MITLIYNISEPEEGGVGRYTYELRHRLKKKIKMNEINLSPSFGKNNFEKLFGILWKRKYFLAKHLSKFSEVNHFTQAEIFFYFKGHGKTIVTMHNPPPTSKIFPNKYESFYSIVRDVLLVNRFKEALKKADFLIANSQLTKERVIDNLKDESKIKVINFGIGKRYSIITPFEKRKNIIGYVGSFATHKRVNKLLKDWMKNSNSLSKFKLKLYGIGGNQFNFLRLTYNNNQNIKFLGLAKASNLPKVYNSFKAFILPSIGESFGFPLLEAIACGTPTFIYKDAIITPEIKKYCITINSIVEVPKLLESIREKEIIKKSKKVKEKFNWDTNIEETIKIYKKFQ